MNKKIQGFNLGYTLWRPLVCFAFRLFYKKIHVENRHYVHSENPIIIAPNHQNALMDALAILYSTIPQRTVFLARADIFQNKIIGSILSFLKILPIFRIRDGKESLNKNDEIFEKSIDVLHDRIPLCLMAEGKHNHRRQLLPLVKGMFRIAFQAQAEIHDKEIYIIPTGIDMGHYSNAGYHLIINHGEPVRVSDFMDAYAENPALAMNNLREHLAEAMKKQMHHIQSEQYYESFYQLSYIANASIRSITKTKNSIFNCFLIRKQITSALDKAEQDQNPILPELHEKCMQYCKNLEQLHFKDEILEQFNYSPVDLFFKSLALILTAPIALYGVVFHALAFIMPPFSVRKIKDLQFHSSVKFVVYFMIAQLLYIAYFIIALCSFPHGWWAFPFLLTLLISGFFAFRYKFWANSVLSKWKYFFKTINANAKLKKLKSDRKDLIDCVVEIFMK